MNKALRFLAGAAGLAAIGLLTGIPSASQVNDQTTRIETNLVLVDVLVVDKAGKTVPGLRREQFEIVSDDVKFPVDIFFSDRAPVSFGVVYDMHPTTSDRTRVVIDSLRRLKAMLGPKDDVFLSAFDMRGLQTFDFIPTAEQLERHMADPDLREPRSLYDAIVLASDKIAGSRNKKRALIIISDSADHESRQHFSQVEDKLATIKTQVYAVLLDNDNFSHRDMNRNGREVFPVSTDATPLDRAALMSLTLKNGGTTYFGGPATAIQLNNLYRDIASDMRSHYMLGFYTEATDGRERSVTVRMHGVENSTAYVLTYKNSYQAPAKH